VTGSDDVFLSRWRKLTQEERRIIHAYVVKQQKVESIAQDNATSRSNVVLKISAVYRLLDVKSQLELAFRMGKHWNLIKKEIEQP